MKFKYKLGDRILWKRTLEEGLTESVGIITEVHVVITKTVTRVHYLLEGNISVSDSDILGTVTIKRSSTFRVKTKKNKVQAQTEINLRGYDKSEFVEYSSDIS